MTKDGESTIQKVKDALHIGGQKSDTTTTHTGTTGTGTGTHVPGTSHTGTTGTGTHVPGTSHTGTTGTGTHIPGTSQPGTTGTGTHIPGTSHTGTTGTHIPGTSHTGTTHTGTTGTHIPGTTGHQTQGHTEGSHGPHRSSVLNAADPRVDSDLDGNRLPNKTSAGYGTQDAYGTGATGTTGTQHHQGTTTGGTGFGGGISQSTNAGPHNSNIANAADPRVDSDLSNTGNHHGASTGHYAFPVSGTHATPGSGTAQNTAGPHNSDLLNKADPRVDADLDGSKTLGGNKTYH
ncbi:hypothetical protein SBOR_6660 [Sclerotinia borealis F-4128]|uniref:Cell surface protein n=1 Tax=Sclerotinia borealis (strain F-4128) TaxID=1432307 RepID=W9CAR9_SCLBF|nr:hypothetical protein SBOR_6660 [Sclerotinia borealis F-4128]